MNLEYFDGVMDCADGLPPSVGRTEFYYRGYGDEYEMAAQQDAKTGDENEQ